MDAMSLIQVPRSCQCMLMSATTSDDVDRLRELMLNSAVDVAVTAASGDTRANTASGSAAEIEHYRIDCDRHVPQQAMQRETNCKPTVSCSSLTSALLLRQQGPVLTVKRG